MSRNSTKQCTSYLSEADWNEEWKTLMRVRRRADDAQHWNSRSKNFGSTDSKSAYARAFLELAHIEAGSQVLDMGCGTGSLAVPLAQAGCEVIAADFSEGMLEQTRLRAAAAGVESVQPQLLAWDDDWERAGLSENCVDIAFASRSIATYDLTAALQKLMWVARSRCMITVSCGCSPRMDERIMQALDLPNTQGRDHQYAWNILTNLGYYPSLSYIQSVREESFDSLEEAVEDFSHMLDDMLSSADVSLRSRYDERLRAWLTDELIQNPAAGTPNGKGHIQKSLTLKTPRVIRWAFIAWDV